ncbi:MAG: cob(I)yrinic acid a,c-diamide adenosyltransferase [bacterium]
MRIYTKTGDRGETDLIGGKRVRKNDPRVEAYGTVDELNSHLGLSRAYLSYRDLAALIEQIQNHLFELGAELAGSTEKSDPHLCVTTSHVEFLEHAIDKLENDIEPLNAFILPGGTPVAAQLHIARSVCRNAERKVIALSEIEEINPEIIRYLNRLSDFLFTSARTVNQRAGYSDLKWRGSSRKT